ncbi:hypothetical protein ILUMI_22224 [Ignelater luminosus]|uniref:Nuclear envelope membrane protein n=1 Tax=Ignelater luminosus TaxID=2038154 RepID=A0A8K0G2U0_IGNLU|nr:hypothetical protein ILUMI_22224 [Ignelater luminosus]
MTAKDKIEAAFKVFIGGCALISTFYAITDLTLFLSNPNPNVNTEKPLSGRDYWASVCKTLFIDQLLLVAFLLVHSVLALPEVKQFVASTLKFQVLQRSAYVILTSLSLQFLVRNWQHVHGTEFWSISTDVKLYWWLFVTLHGLAWVVIYVGTICMDVNELLGIKQVYYNIQHLPDPNIYKSHELKRLYSHMRHPSFVGFSIILWLIPCMSLDRLLLATILSIYMFLGWNTDRHDCNYQKLQFIKKFHEFNYVQ